MDRTERIRGLEAAIGNRTLVWFGTRGSDAHALLEIDQFRECYSMIAPLGSSRVDCDISLEELSHARVDLDTYSIDDDRSEAADRLHASLMESLSRPSVFMEYRPNGFSTSVRFAGHRSLAHLNMFHERQSAFDHKPWVEVELSAAGMPVVPWLYFSDQDRERAVRAVGLPMIVRPTRSDGGAGLHVATTPEEVAAVWPTSGDRLVSCTEYLEGTVPLNVGGCVFDDGTISLHGPSFQIIGVPALTNLRLGYCGNDFARIRDLESSVVDDLERVVRRAGAWLHRQGYLGAFGVDALLHQGRLYVSEINPRFQGSTSVSVELDRAAGRADILLNHAAAFLHLPPPPQTPLRELAAEQTVSQVIAHNLTERPLFLMGQGFEQPDREADHRTPRFELVPGAGIGVEPGAILFRAVLDHSSTEDGFSMDETVESEVRAKAVGAFAASAS